MVVLPLKSLGKQPIGGLMKTIKKEPTIQVTTVFDGSKAAKDVFADLIIEKNLRQARKPLPKPDFMLYNSDSIPMNHGRLDCAVNQP